MDFSIELREESADCGRIEESETQFNPTSTSDSAVTRYRKSELTSGDHLSQSWKAIGRAMNASGRERPNLVRPQTAAALPSLATCGAADRSTTSTMAAPSNASANSSISLSNRRCFTNPNVDEVVSIFRLDVTVEQLVQPRTDRRIGRDHGASDPAQQCRAQPNQNWHRSRIIMINAAPAMIMEC